MKKLFNKLKGAVEQKFASSAFQNIFKPVAETQPELANELTEFCLHGEPTSSLIKAQQSLSGKVGDLNHIASTSWLHYSKNKATDKARYALYQSAAEGKIELEQLVRLGKAFAAMLKNNISKHTPDNFPDWLHILLTDFCYERSNTNKNNKHILFYEKLCEAGELHPATWLCYIYDRKGAGSYWGFNSALIGMRNIEGFADYLLKHKDYLTQTLYPSLVADGKAQVIKELKQSQVTNDFQEFITQQCFNSSKKVSAEASAILNTYPKAFIHEQLKDKLNNGNAAERKQAASLIARILEAEGSSMLQQALESETSQSVQSAIQLALGTAEINDHAQSEEIITLPEYEAPDLSSDVSPAVVESIYEKIKKLQAAQAEIEPEYPYQKDHKKRVMALSRADAVKIVDVMNGKNKGEVWRKLSYFMNDPQLFSDKSIQLIHIMRLHAKPNANDRHQSYAFNWGPLELFLNKQADKLTDLRQLQDVTNALGWLGTSIEKEILCSEWRQSFLFVYLPPEGIWPFFAKRLDTISAALMAQGQNTDRYEGISLDRILDVLSCFESLPNQVKTSLLHIALAEGKTYRARAQQLLTPVPGIEQSVAAALKSTAQEARINAARWLAKIGNVSAVPALQEALKKEKREAARANIMSALEALGEDISELLNPDNLLIEAEKGLKKQMPKSLAWFPFDAQPALKWSDGSKVDNQIAKWWIVLACKLKEPGGNELLVKYLERLDEASQQNFGMYILQAFISQDTRCPSLEEAETEAKQRAPGLFSSWQQWAKSEWGKEYANRTLEDAHAEIRNAVLATYLGSAIKDKGILALCSHCNGADAIDVVRKYMKDHYTRRAQIESMLKALAPGNNSHVIQLLLSVARRYRTKSVQELARTLVEEVAERNGWTQDELADRTLPSAGYDQDGRMQLNYGSRQFTVSLDSKLKPVIANEDGKVIKSLPASRQADDEALVKEAKSQLSASKKELKQVIPLTTSRFYEAMCAEREWPATDWVSYIFEHPLANRLAQGLIWRYKNESQNSYFRPTEDGALIDLDDDELDLPTQGTISLAHCSTMSSDENKGWSAHLKDYAVKPLFEQLKRPVLDDASASDKTKLNTYEGYLSDSFTLRGSFTKLGYQRGAAEDGGFFYYYFKDFNSLGLRAIVLFSGNCLPEENVAAALQDLCFSKLKNNSWFNERDLVPFKEVPPILLSEVIADYKTVADKTGGFDPNWEKKMPW